MNPRGTAEASRSHEGRDLRSVADAELRNDQAGAARTFTREHLEDRIAFARASDLALFAVLHEDDEHRDVGIDLADEVERARGFLRGLAFGAEHERVTI